MPIQPDPARRRRRRRTRRRPPPPVSRSSTDSDSDDTWHSPRGGSTAGEPLDGMPERDGCLSEVDLESGELEMKVHEKRDCRICHLRLVGERERGDGDEDDSGDDECCGGGAIELGCSCKGDLAAAHKQCADTWFKIRGNTTCEICGATARNVVAEQTNTSNATIAVVTAPSAPPTLVTLAETQHFWHGRRLMNILLGCMVFAFIVSWLFHFNLLSHRQ